MGREQMPRVLCPLAGCKRFHKLKRARNGRDYVSCEKWATNLYFRSEAGLAWVRSHGLSDAQPEQTARAEQSVDEEGFEVELD